MAEVTSNFSSGTEIPTHLLVEVPPKLNLGIWPLALDDGVEDQFAHDLYCQPPARIKNPEKNLNSSTKEHTEEGMEAVPTPFSNNFGQILNNSENAKHPERHPKEIDSSIPIDNDDFVVPMETEFYHPADLEVRLTSHNGTGYTFIGSSHALALASTVWEKTLNPGPFRELESKVDPTTGNIIKLTNLEQEDDPKAVYLIFKIIHLQTKEVPKDLSFDFLRSLAIVCDKYGCGAALVPWGDIWLKNHEDMASKGGYEDWIFIAKVLAPEMTKVREISRALVLESSSISLCGTYLLRDLISNTVDNLTVHEVELQFIPDDVVEYIKDERSRVIRLVTRYLRMFVSRLSSAASEMASTSTIERVCSDEHCLDATMGSLIRSMKKLKLWPLVKSGEPQQWEGSVSALVWRIRNIKMTTLIKKTIVKKIGSSGNSNGFGGSGQQRSLFGQNTSTQPVYEDFPESHVGIAVSGAPPQKLSAWNSEHRKASTIESLRFSHPAFSHSFYSEQYMPCKSAFYLGTLISKCQNVLDNIENGGFDDLGVLGKPSTSSEK